MTEPNDWRLFMARLADASEKHPYIRFECLIRNLLEASATRPEPDLDALQRHRAQKPGTPQRPAGGKTDDLPTARAASEAWLSHLAAAEDRLGLRFIVLRSVLPTDDEGRRLIKIAGQSGGHIVEYCVDQAAADFAGRLERVLNDIVRRLADQPDPATLAVRLHD